MGGVRRASALGSRRRELGAGANDAYLSQIETGQRDIRCSTITRLLRALGATITELAGEVERESLPKDPTDRSRRTGDPGRRKDRR